MTGGGAGGGRNAAALSDRHTDLADKMAEALRRAQKRHVDNGLLSIEAAESYLEAGRLHLPSGTGTAASPASSKPGRLSFDREGEPE